MQKPDAGLYLVTQKGRKMAKPSAEVVQKLTMIWLGRLEADLTNLVNRVPKDIQKVVPVFAEKLRNKLEKIEILRSLLDIEIPDSPEMERARALISKSI